MSNIIAKDYFRTLKKQSFNGVKGYCNDIKNPNLSREALHFIQLTVDG